MVQLQSPFTLLPLFFSSPAGFTIFSWILYPSPSPHSSQCYVFHLMPISRQSSQSLLECIPSGFTSTFIWRFRFWSRESKPVLWQYLCQCSWSLLCIITGKLLKARVLGHLQRFWFSRSRSEGAPVSLFFTGRFWSGDLQIGHTKKLDKSNIHFWFHFQSAKEETL